MVDDKGLLLGIHFHKYRRVPLEQISIIKAALSDAARKIDELNAKKSNAPSSPDAKQSGAMKGYAVFKGEKA